MERAEVERGDRQVSLVVYALAVREGVAPVRVRI